MISGYKEYKMKLDEIILALPGYIYHTHERGTHITDYLGILIKLGRVLIS